MELTDAAPHVDEEPSPVDAPTGRIRVEGLTKVFGPSPTRALALLADGRSKDEILRATGDVVALHDVAFTVGEGEIFIVMGLSGSGKSTLLRCLNRLVVPTSGRVLVDDDDVTTLTERDLRSLRRGKVAMVFQHFALLPHKTLIENVAYGLKVQRVRRAERERRARAALDLVGLSGWTNRLPRSLSGGMQQRVGLARALATDPDILLMDEPFSALDPLIRQDMQRELIELQARLRKTIVFITHDIAEALKLGDRVAIMRDGVFVQQGTPEQLVTQPADGYVRDFVRGVDRGQVLRVSAVMAPVVAVGAGDRVAEAASQIERHGLVFVVDAERRPIGVMGAPELRLALRAETEDVVALTRRGVAQVPADAPLEAAYRTCAAGQPVAVVDVEGRLVGSLAWADVLGSLAKDDLPSGRPPGA